MSLPEQVRLQAERANELMNQASQQPGEPAPAPAPPAPAPAPAPVAPDPAPQPAEPQPAPAPAPAPADPAPAPAPAPVENWEHKYRTLQGVMNAQKREFDARIAELTAKIATLSAPAPTPTPAPAPQARVTDQDVETYGTEMLDLIGRKAAEMAEQIVNDRMAKLEPQLQQTREQVDSVAQRVYVSAEQEFYGELTKVVADWETINQDPKFLNWLAQEDSFSGVQRQALLEAASAKLDHVRVATFFDKFKTDAGLNRPAPAPAPAPAAPPVSPSPRPVGTASAPAITEPQTGVARSEIAAHYRRSATDPVYRASADAKAFEQRMNQALLANTIIEA